MRTWPGTADARPLAWWGFPVYATTLLVIAHCVCFALAALAGPLGFAPLVMGMVFSSGSILQHFAVWQLATYAFVPLPLSLWFLLEMAMLYFFGLEVEKTLGRRMYLTLYALMLLAPSVSLLFAGLFGTSSVLAGASAIHFGVFLAFALIAPGLPIFFGISAKWLALGLGVFNSLMLFAHEQWTGLFALWVDAGVAWAVMGALGYAPLPRWPGRAKSDRPAPAPVPQPLIPTGSPSPKDHSQPRPRPAPSAHKDPDPLQDIDPILEKISSQGLQSLTPAERRKLEQARARLLQREKP